MKAFRQHSGRVLVFALVSLFTILFFAAVSSAETPQPPRSVEKATAVIHCSYAPVTYWDKNTDKPAGFAVDLINSVATRARLEVSYTCKPGWAEMIAAVESGEADLGVLLKSEEREKVLLFSSPIDVTYLSYFARSPNTVNPDTLPLGYLIGIIKGSRSLEYFKNRQGVRLSVEGSYQEGIFSLLGGKIDIFAAEESLVLKQAREAGLEDRITRIGRPFSEQGRCLAVRKDNRKLLELLNSSLQGFVGSSEYQRIYLKWYGAPASYWTTGKMLVASGAVLFVAFCGMAYWRYSSIFDLNRELVRTIDERTRTEERLRESELKFRKTTEQLAESQRVGKIGGWSWDIVNNTLDWSDETFRRFDKDPATFTPTVAYYVERIHPDDRTAIQKAIQDSLENNTRYHILPRIINENGREWVLEGFGVVERDESGKPLRFAGTAQDITERHQAEEALRESQELFSLFMRYSPIYAYIKTVTPTESRVLQASENFQQMVGIPGSKMVGKSMAELFPAEIAAKITADDWAVVSTGEPLRVDEELDGRCYTSIKYPLVRNGSTMLAGYTIDVTDRNRAEDQVRRSLAEKTVLLKEIHHRVKNNMQVVYSLLNLQARGVTDATARAMFEESRNRIVSMALIHEKLYQSQDLGRIDFKQYLTSLVAGLAASYHKQHVTLTVDMEPLTLDVNVGIPCGLIVNELVSNSLKYAFPGERAGTIVVGINRDREGNKVLTVADNGIGFPHTVDFRNTSSLGLQLVNVLTGQIHGAIELVATAGTTFRITFPADPGETPNG